MRRSLSSSSLPSRRTDPDSASPPRQSGTSSPSSGASRALTRASSATSTRIDGALASRASSTSPAGTSCLSGASSRPTTSSSRTALSTSPSTFSASGASRRLSFSLERLVRGAETESHGRAGRPTSLTRRSPTGTAPPRPPTWLGSSTTGATGSRWTSRCSTPPRSSSRAGASCLSPSSSSARPTSR